MEKSKDFRVFYMIARLTKNIFEGFGRGKISSYHLNDSIVLTASMASQAASALGGKHPNCFEEESRVVFSSTRFQH